MKTYIFIFNLIIFSCSFCQGIAIGEWREHLPYQQVISVAETPAKVYAATPYALFVYDKEYNSISKMSKVNILSDIGVGRIAYHNKTKTLIIGYTNGNIDLYKNNKIRNVSDIKRANIPGDKKIYNIRFYEDDIYLACGFGIVVFSIDKQEIKDTYYIGHEGSKIKVFDIAFHNDTIVAATEKGIYLADINSPNLANYIYWNNDSAIYRPNVNYNLAYSFNDYLIVNMTNSIWDQDTLFIYNNGIWSYFPNVLNSLTTQIRSYDNELIISQVGAIRFFNSALVETHLIYLQDNFIWPLDFVKDSQDNDIFWIGDNSIGLIKNWKIWTNEFIKPESPYTSNIYSFDLLGSILIGVAGGRDQSWGNTYTQGCAFKFENERWSSFERSNISALDTIYDLLAVAIHPGNTNRWFLGSYDKGMVEMLNNEVLNVFDNNNSPLNTAGATNLVKITDMKFDKNNNLWILTTPSNSGQCLTVKTNYNQWKSFAFSGVSSSDNLGKLLNDSYENKWMILPRGGGILVFNDNGTLDNTSDDKFIKLTTTVGNGNLPSLRVHSIAEDRNGRIWVGTDEGIAVFYYPQNLFTGGNFDAEHILVDVGGYVQPLMKEEVVNCIAVDGANRKWLGTAKAGVFLLSADGTKEVLHFNENNSPLLSNSIADIAIDHNTGEVFFGTYSGIISYKGTATEGKETYNDSEENNVYAYPNPVKSNYNGYIAIKNLVTDSDIKITDIYGNLIYKTTAHGGQAVWDGKMPTGEKPASGVFLVFASNADGSETMVTKILFLH